jgi:hypothetical protein
MKILRLQAENVKRLTAVDITPDPAAHVIKIGGKNGNGKSSALDTISIALGGAALCPVEPIHASETEGMARLDLGELVVTRRFKRDVVVAHGPKFIPEDKSIQPGVTNGIYDHLCDDTCTQTFGPTTSTLVVANRDGAKYPTPQAILDRLRSDLTFDPHAFARASEKEQNAILRRIAGIDTDKIDEARKMAVALRTDLNRQVKAKEALLVACAHYPDAPSTEIPVSEATAALQGAETTRRIASDAASTALRARQLVETAQQRHDTVMSQINDWQSKIDAARVTLGTIEASYTEAKAIAETEEASAEKAKALVPDVAATQAVLTGIEDTNKKVRANAARAAVVADLTRVTEAAKKQDDIVNICNTEKAALLAGAVFPVAGLGLTENGVTFNSVPFAQAGSANQLRTSVSIGMALNPALRVLRVDNGNMLDEDSMALLEEMAELHDFQIWMEIVTADPGTVSVFITDGGVDGAS